MRARLFGVLCLLLAAAGAALVAPPADPGAAARPAPVAAAEDPREILVMLHLPAPHFRPDAYHGGKYREDAARAARRRTAQALAREHGMEVLEDWAMPALNVDCFRMRRPDG